MRRAVLAWIALILLAFTLGVRAGDELTVTVEVTSADHELAEGYFSLGQTASVIAKPGSPLFDWLRARIGQRVRVTLAVAPADSER